MPRRQLDSYKNQINDLRQRLRQNQEMTKDAQIDAIAALLTWQVMENASFQDLCTDRKVKACWQRNYEKNKAIAAEFYNALGQNKIQSILRNNDNDKTLVKNFKIYIADRDRFPENLESPYKIKASYRIQQLKENMKKGKYQSPDERRHALAEILAVREAVKAGRGSAFSMHWTLSARYVPGDVSKEADRIDEELKKVPSEILEEHYRRMQGITFGGAMQEALEPYRKPAVVREMLQVQETLKDLQAENAHKAGAKLIWLLKHQNMTDEEFSEAKAGDMIDEVENIQNSLVYNRFVQSMSEKEFMNILKNVDPKHPEKGQELLEAYDRAEQMEAQRDPWAINLYNRLMSDPQALANFQKTINELSNPDFLKALNVTLGDKNVLYNRLDDFKEALFNIDEDKNNFIKQAELFRERFCFCHNTYFSTDNKKHIYDDFPKFKEFYDEMNFPEQGTAENMLLHQMGGVEPLNEAVGDAGYANAFFGRIAFYEQVRGSADWKKVQIDKNQLKKRMDELNASFGERDMSIANLLSSEKLYSLVRTPGNEKELLNIYNKAIADRNAELERMNTQTVEDRIEEIAEFSKRRNLFNAGAIDRDDIEDAQVEVLLSRKVCKEYTEHPENFKTVDDVNKCWEKYYSSYNKVVDHSYQNRGDDAKNFRLLQDESGQTLEDAIKKSIPGCRTDIELMKNIDASLQPTAREHIEAITKSIRSNLNPVDITLFSWKNKTANFLSSIIAAREVLQVRPGIPGGDDRMNVKMNDRIYDKAHKIKTRLLNDLKDDELFKLYQAAAEGHGGKLQESYRKLMEQKASEMDAIPEQTPENQLPSAKLRIESMQKKLKTAKNMQEKLHCVAEIIAARQLTEAVRGDIFGGDDRLNDTLDPKKLSKISKDVEDYLSYMPEEVLNRLIRKAGRGHGGAMTEEYMAQNTYQNQSKWMRAAYENAAPDAKKPDIAKALFISLKAVKLKNNDVTINGEGIRNRVDNLYKNPAYERFSTDPEIPNLFVRRDMNALQMKWNDAERQVKNENIIQARQNMVQNPVQNPGQNQVSNPGQNPVPEGSVLAGPAPAGPSMH
ncbi:hypothetical protein SAMN06297422_11742 [Lachnospiraceae bacterium]|nr:hypothetical protein SAMN06297422_11742 [Lachnospiraceae bacterium]